MKRLHMRRMLHGSETPSDAVVPLDLFSKQALAQLLLDAYRDTVDYEGEELPESIEDINRVLGSSGPRLFSEASGVTVVDGRPASAIIVNELDAAPFISFVFTHPEYQRRGHAERLIENACAWSAANGYDHIDLWVTAGSQGESLYRRIGFVPVVEQENDRQSASMS